MQTVNSLHLLLPEGIHRWLQYRRRFRDLGLPTMWALSRAHRFALETTQIEMLPQPLRPLTCVVDVGANSGEWSTGLLRLVEIEHLVAFEPIPDVYAQLVEHTKDFPQITCHQAAVGAQSGRINIYAERLSQVSSVLPITEEGRSYHALEDALPEVVEVPLVTLDEALSQFDEISLLKVDVQGYESAVFTGARSVLQRTRMIMTEVLFHPYYQGASDFQEIIELVTGLAPFRLWCVSAPHYSRSGKPVWADALFVRASEAS